MSERIPFLVRGRNLHAEIFLAVIAILATSCAKTRRPCSPQSVASTIQCIAEMRCRYFFEEIGEVPNDLRDLNLTQDQGFLRSLDIERREYGNECVGQPSITARTIIGPTYIVYFASNQEEYVFVTAGVDGQVERPADSYIGLTLEEMIAAKESMGDDLVTKESTKGWRFHSTFST